MKRVRVSIPTYSADTFGVCSALYELGGLIVMHDASGCNSTYTTHDEPRWWDSPSDVYISALTEMDAMMGNDEKLINDVIDATKDKKPNFIAIVGTPIPMMSGFDFDAVSKEIEYKTGIPTIGFPTTGMKTYFMGVRDAYVKIAERFLKKSKEKRPHSINILGATPLDFGKWGTIKRTKEVLLNANFEIISCFSMSSTFEDIKKSPLATINLVISSTGLSLAKYMKKNFDIPYVVGDMIKDNTIKAILDCLTKTENDGVDRVFYKDFGITSDKEYVIIGEPVSSHSFAYEKYKTEGALPIVVNPLELTDEMREVLLDTDISTMEEKEIKDAIKDVKKVIADPLYKYVIPKGAYFEPLPHLAFSGRQFI